MKKAELNQLTQAILHSQKEAITVIHEGKVIGYFYPNNDLESVSETKHELASVLDKVMEETGLNEAELVKAFTEETKSE